MTMVERIARAMADGSWDAKSFTETPNGETPDEFRAYWSDKARAALSAMMEPTFAVKMAGAQAITAEHMKANANYDAACDAWQAMIQAALDEGEG